MKEWTTISVEKPNAVRVLSKAESDRLLREHPELVMDGRFVLAWKRSEAAAGEKEAPTAIRKWGCAVRHSGRRGQNDSSTDTSSVDLCAWNGEPSGHQAL